MNKMLFLAIAIAVVVAVGAGTGIQHVLALGDCYSCQINLGGEHHQHGDCTDSDCSDEGSSDGGSSDGN